MAANYNDNIKELGRFMFMSLLLMAIPFLASEFGAGVLFATAFLLIFGLLVWGGIFKNAPRRNALAVVPAFSLSGVFSYYYWYADIPSFPWAATLLAIWVICAGLFTYSSRNSSSQ